jgi:hypothetical protein
MSLEELIDLMQDEMHDAHQEIEKFVNGNKSAGTRARKSMQIVKIIKGASAPFFILIF